MNYIKIIAMIDQANAVESAKALEHAGVEIGRASCRERV